MVTPHLILLVTGALLAGVVQGISGFAFGMVAMAVWAWSMDPAEATVMAVFGGLCGQVLAATTIRRPLVASELFPFLVGGLLGVPLGTYILPYISETQFKLVLGIILVAGCSLMFAMAERSTVRSGGRIGDGVAGVVGGTIGGISGMTGIAPAIWCTLRGYDKARQRALVQTFNLVTLTATMVALVWKDVATRDMLPGMAVVAVAVVIPSMAGARIYKKLSDASFRRVVLVILVLSGLGLIGSAIAGLSG